MSVGALSIIKHLSLSYPAITLTFLVAVVALVLVTMKMADGESSAPPKQETKVQGKRQRDKPIIPFS